MKALPPPAAPLLSQGSAIGRIGRIGLGVKAPIGAVYSLLFMVYGLWFMVYGLWFIADIVGVCNPSGVVPFLCLRTPGRASPTQGLVMMRPFQGLKYLKLLSNIYPCSRHCVLRGVVGCEFMSMCDGDCLRGRDVSRPYNLLVLNGLRGAFFSGRWVDSGA